MEIEDYNKVRMLLNDKKLIQDAIDYMHNSSILFPRINVGGDGSEDKHFMLPRESVPFIVKGLQEYLNEVDNDIKKL